MITRRDAIAVTGWVGWGFVDYITKLEDIDEVMDWYNDAIAEINLWNKAKGGGNPKKGKG